MLTILVSCDSDNSIFKQCVEQICNESNEEYRYRHIPDEVAPPNEKDRLQRMLDLVRDSDMVFMDATPSKFVIDGNEEYLTNPGVLIEYGVLVSYPSYEMKLKVFCEESISRKHLHAYFIQTAHSYSTVDAFDESNPRSLKSQIKKMIEDYKKILPELLRKSRETLELYRRISRLEPP